MTSTSRIGSFLRHGAAAVLDAPSLEISLIAGDQYRKFLNANVQITKKLMGW